MFGNQQAHFDGESTVGGVGSLHRTTMHPNCALCDGEAQSCTATALAITCVFSAIERLENLFQRFGGNTVSSIANTYHSEVISRAILFPQRDLDSGSFRCKPKSIAYHVLNCAS